MSTVRWGSLALIEVAAVGVGTALFLSMRAEVSTGVALADARLGGVSGLRH